MFADLLLLIIFIACFVMLMNSGLWSNTLTLVNVITAALVATNYFEPFANWLEAKQPAGGYFFDFLALWLIFLFTVTILRSATDYLSGVRVRFFMPVEKAGGPLMAAWVSWIMVCFVAMTMHTAPLSRNFLGFQAEPTTQAMFGAGPDRVWLGWMHRQSQGSLSRLKELVPFDRYGDFILRYGARREEIEASPTITKRK